MSKILKYNVFLYFKLYMFTYKILYARVYKSWVGVFILQFLFLLLIHNCGGMFLEMGSAFTLSLYNTLMFLACGSLYGLLSSLFIM